ncbi:MAG: 16S rRNA (cytosine(967)-C(5))-methyltransferase RsmB [Bacillota bacterium]|nr:16S rRNA (cytosine(967)-C(5))-methyltransferase RsmB [Bacillota bacterium]
MKNARKVAVDIVNQVLEKGAYSNIALSNELNKSNLEDKDRGLVTEIVYGTIKYKYTIDKIINYFVAQGIKKIDGYILNLLRISIYQIRYLERIPEFAAVNEAVKIAKKYRSEKSSKFVNGVLRNYLRNKEADFIKSSDEIAKLCFQHSYDPWMVKLFIKQYGRERALEILKGLNETPDVTVRVNNLKGNYEDVLQKLSDLGYEVREGYICPEAIKIEKGKNIEKNPLFSEGYFTVQDESAMLVAPAMEIEEEMNIIDLCSAPGGKATHMGELLNNTGELIACDIHENKISLIKENVERLGLRNIKYKTLDASKFDENFENRFDRVLIDVPCSGIGIIRKKPEIKWSKDNNQLDRIVKIQRDIMDNASRYVKNGGILLYSTCTINKGENETNIDWFLKNHKDYNLEKIFYGPADNLIYNTQGSVTIIPNKYMDGFFIAKLRRQW